MNKEHGLIVATSGVQTILEDRKTQTRRVIKFRKRIPNPISVYGHGGIYSMADQGFELRLDEKPNLPCPYGQVGDRLWVKETHYRWGKWIRNGFTKTGKQKWTFRAFDEEIYYCDNPPAHVLPNKKRDLLGYFKRSSRFMFHKDSRITLEITGVRVERLQEITEEDAKLEGLIADPLPTVKDCLCDSRGMRHICKFIDLWDSLNAKRGYGWEVNPWVWVISFRRLTDGEYIK